MIKLSIVVGVLNRFEMFEEAFLSMVENLSKPYETEFIIIDNGSDKVLGETLPVNQSRVSSALGELGGYKVIRNKENTGNYPMFKQGLELANGEVVAFLHSDVIVHDKGWDEKVMAQFEAREDLGLIGFIGSTEIDRFGGRGGGTVSNMVKHGDMSSEAEAHGKRSEGMTVDGSVVDGCVMIFRKSVLESIEHKEDFPRHHFYDRMLSCQVAEKGFRIGILGIKFSHLNGQTANHEDKWWMLSKQWAKDNLGISEPAEWLNLHPEWVKSTTNPSRGHQPNGWDHVAYLEAEYRFLKEFRDEKHLVPLVFGKRI